MDEGLQHAYRFILIPIMPRDPSCNCLNGPNLSVVSYDKQLILNQISHDTIHARSKAVSYSSTSRNDPKMTVHEYY